LIKWNAFKTQRLRTETLFYQVTDIFVVVHTMQLPNVSCVINLVTGMNDRLYQMLLWDENAEIQE